MGDTLVKELERLSQATERRKKELKASANPLDNIMSDSLGAYILGIRTCIQTIKKERSIKKMSGQTDGMDNFGLLNRIERKNAFLDLSNYYIVKHGERQDECANCCHALPADLIPRETAECTHRDFARIFVEAFYNKNPDALNFPKTGECFREQHKTFILNWKNAYGDR